MLNRMTSVSAATAHDVSEKHRIFDLALEKLDCLLRAAVVGVRCVTEEIRNNFQKVRLAGAKEARNPYAHLACGVRIFLIRGFEIPGDEFPEMLVEFSCDDKLLQLLPKTEESHQAGHLNHAVCWTGKYLVENRFSMSMCAFDLWNQPEGPVVVMVLELPEQPKRLTVISSGVEHDEWRRAHDRLQVVQQGV